MEENNEIDFTFLDTEEKKFNQSIMIVINSDFDEEQFMQYRSKSDYVICLDLAVNRLDEICTKSGIK